jgi:phosphoglycolate phosphatase-like HAD superfamily hydrolase
MIPSPSTLIFDLDGTLIDSKAVILACFGKAAETVFPGKAFSQESVRLGPPLQRMFQISFPEATENEVIELVRAFRSHYDHEGPIKTHAYDGATEVLANCQSRNVSLYVATNKPLRISMAILANLKLDHFFRSILALDSIQPPFAGKVEIVRYLLQSSQLKPSETWYVGDSSEDAAAAAACDLPFIWAAYGYGQLGQKETKSVTRAIHKLAELKELLC